VGCGNPGSGVCRAAFDASAFLFPHARCGGREKRGPASERASERGRWGGSEGGEIAAGVPAAAAPPSARGDSALRLEQAAGRQSVQAGSGRASRRRAVRRLSGRWLLRSRSLLPLLSHPGLPDCELVLALGGEHPHPGLVLASFAACPLLRGPRAGGRREREAAGEQAERGPPATPHRAGARDAWSSTASSPRRRAHHPSGVAAQPATSAGRTRTHPGAPAWGSAECPRAAAAEVKGLPLQHGNSEGQQWKRRGCPAAG
jgi:hypothetical protein